MDIWSGGRRVWKNRAEIDLIVIRYYELRMIPPFHWHAVGDG